MNRSSAGRFRLSFLFGLFALQVTQPAVAQQPPVAPVKSPLSPEESLRHFKLAPGLRIELVAAEPEVIDPVSIAFDENGILWAVEMTDYPNGPSPGQPPMSRIRALRDKDGDGRYETSQVFADKLLFATGVQPWKGGVIVTLAGEITWFKDSDGDDKADVRETWFRGFAEQNPQLRANHPRWHWDNRIYVANGLRGGTVKADAKTWGRDLPPIQINGFDFRFNPQTGEGEPISGVGQFGMTFDDYGNRFVCSNRNPCRHIILEDHYLKRNPLLAVKDVGQDVVPSGADSRVYPISRAWTTSTQHAGQFTAACGVTIYRGSALPKDYYGNVFTCEPTGNLVHREVLRPKGVTFEAVPQTSTAEFLASPDEWFRPVDLANGPDGALYVVDMYRAVIEHPEWVPDELKNRPDERDGSDRGRIYRIVAEDRTRSQRPAVFPADNIQALIGRLTSTDSWQAETAGRRLIELRHEDTKTLLLKLVRYSDSALARWRAYHLLASISRSGEEMKIALSDRAPEVRGLGALITEPLLERDADGRMEVLKQLAGPSQPRMRLQAALSLSSATKNPDVVRALASLMSDKNDEWIRQAVLIAIGQKAADFFNAWTEQLDAPSIQAIKHIPAMRDVTQLLGAQQDSSILAGSLRRILELKDQRLRVVGFLGLCQGIQSRGRSARDVIAEMSRDDHLLAEALGQLFKQARTEIVNVLLEQPVRLEYLSLLEFGRGDDEDAAFLRSLLTGLEQDIDVKAIDILATYDAATVGPGLVDDSFNRKSAAVRRAIIRYLLRNPRRIRALFDAIEMKYVSLVDLDPNQVKALLNHPDAEVQRDAQKILAAAVPQERKVVLEQYQRALKLDADPQRGRLVFEKQCATCHQIGKVGVVVGPDITDYSRTKSPAQMLVDILSPNQAIDNNYISYTVLTKDGRVETGFIANETTASITMKQPENKTLLILRTDIEELKSNGVSLMPEGLEKNITVEQMADLISFVKNWRYLDGQVPIKVSP